MNAEKVNGLRYTGHPFVDVGLAVMTVWNDIRNPEELTQEHLETVASDLRSYYSHDSYKKLRGLFCRVCFPNSHYTQHAKKFEDRLLYSDDILFLFRENVEPLDNVQCTFFPEKPAVMYATRQHIPLLNSAKTNNFSSNGERGIPVSGEALLAIHAMPFGAIICGNLLVLHQTRYINDDSPDMNFIFALHSVKTNRQAAQLISQNPDSDMPKSSYRKTRYIQALLSAQQTLREEGEDPSQNTNISGYYFTNDNRGADLEILQLDSTVLRFIDAAQHEAYKDWRSILRQYWVDKKGQSGTPNEHEIQFWRNQFYEALFLLPQDARRFIKRLKGHWKLIEVFLREVMQMEQERIDTYRDLGDRLAQYMVKYELPAMGFYHRIAGADKYPKFRSAIKSAAMKAFKGGEENPLIEYDEFITAFEHPSDGYSQWRLGRDLVAFRMLEVLHANRDLFDPADLPDEFPEEDIDEE